MKSWRLSRQPRIEYPGPHAWPPDHFAEFVPEADDASSARRCSSERFEETLVRPVGKGGGA
jgi:hypothetical protein